MTDWSDIIIKALRELRADTVFTRGAILHGKVSEIARRSGLDFDRHLKETNQKFSSVVQKVENVELHKRPNTDMFVGLIGATWPEAATDRTRRIQQRFRADVYEAFTRISDSDYWYLPDTDEFVNDIAKDDTRRRLRVPSVSLEALLSQRRGFAEKSEAGEELRKAIDRSPNPLAAFQAEISRLRLGREWHVYKSKTLRETIEAWADRNGIAFSPQWREAQDLEHKPQSPQQLMATFAAYMTDEEVRSTSVPFRAVEAMYRSVTAFETKRQSST